VRRRLAGTDDPAHLLPGVGVRFRPSMHHEHDYMPNHAYRLPPFFPGLWITPAGGQGITEHQLGSLEAQPVVPCVGAVLFVVPGPTQVDPPCNYNIVVTWPPSCQERALAVYLHTADKYRRFTRRPPQEQKGLDERARMVS
jgi:hypothetical protein